ncbi:uri1, prefoldin-like chaperone [Entomortierella chlamydospora]|uniref:Uri1, prefoldin-like chaperone n=1 Tax=Entomortierella chlamydospora TaxID=101097 RepID=A0A9P6N603_9FUNG|nr:uri1, prefoldin-like chaperone [Entomortierella chlamydospora]
MDRSKDKVSEAEAAELAKYFSKFSAALTQLEEEMARWKNYEEDYKALKTTLLDLPKETSHSVMVPIGSLAFMPGKLVHTNEILVMLGDNWFVDRSATQAAEIVDRRMEFVQENITKLQAQEEQIRTKSGMAPGLLGGQEYNEEGLPIVEITEPYFSDDEEGNDGKKSAQPAPLPFSQKTPKEQAEDRAILERIAELEREDEERERRREAGEIVTSDEETESDDEPVDYDDEESEDEFRPKALDSDEEYEEEVWEHSGNEEEEDEEEELVEQQGVSPKRSVRFADQVARATKPKSKTNTSNNQSASASATASTKPKSPSDLFNLMKAKQQAARSSALTDQIVTMDNLESTFASMTTAGSSSRLSETPLIEEVTKPEPAPLKSALKPPRKKTSLFKQMRAQSSAAEPINATPTVVAPTVVEPKVSLDIQETPPKKMSKFAMERAAAAGAGAATTAGMSKGTKLPENPAVGGISEQVFERNISTPPTPKKATAPGVFEVVERNAPAPVKENKAAEPQSIVGIKDIIENTFTKPSSSSSPIKDAEPTRAGRKKPSLFRQQQHQTTSSYLEPEPAIPGSSVVEVGEDVEEYQSPRTIPPVVSARSKASSGSILETKEPPKATGSTMRTIPIVASSKLKDTALMKGTVVEHEEVEPIDEDEFEDDMLMRQVVSEYQERRQAMIAKHGAFNREGIEQLWEQQVVIPPEMIIPAPQIESIEDRGDDVEEDEGDDDEAEPENNVIVDDRNLPPKKLSLFRAARLSGTLAKQT